MRSIKLFIVYSIMIISLLSSCSPKRGENELMILPVTLSNVKSVTLNDGRLLGLENNDSSLLYSITDIVNIKDKIFIHSGDMVKSFSISDGHHIKNIGHKGHGPGEFNQVSQIWAKDSSLYIFDFNTSSVNVYNEDGTFLMCDREYLYNTDNAHRPSYIFEYPDTSYIVTINTYTDQTTKINPLASIYGSERNFIRDISGRDLVTGGHLTVRTTYDEDNKRVLYWEGFNDTIFSITTKTISPSYVIDFGPLRFPYQDEHDFLTKARIFYKDSLLGKQYATLIQSIQKHNEHLFFTFTVGTETIFLCSTNLDNKQSNVYSVLDSNYQLASTIKLINDSLFIELKNIVNEEANPAILIIPTSHFF